MCKKCNATAPAVQNRYALLLLVIMEMKMMFLVFLMVDTLMMMIGGCFWRGPDVLTESGCNPVRERGSQTV